MMEHAVLDDRVPQGVAFGLVQAFRDCDDVTLKRLLAAAVGRGDRLFTQTLSLLVDLVVPHLRHFEIGDGFQEHRTMQELILCRSVALESEYERIVKGVRRLPQQQQAVHLAALVQLVAALVDAHLVDVPRVAFAEGTS